MTVIMHQQHAPCRRLDRRIHAAQRGGLVLVAVTVAIVLASLAAFGMALRMQTEHRAAQARADQLQADAAASAGRELLAWLLELSADQRRELGGLRDNPALFHGIGITAHSAQSVLPSRADDGFRFSIFTSSYASPEGARGGPVSGPLPVRGNPAFGDAEPLVGRYGVVNESSKLNLNQLVLWDETQPGLGRYALLQIPGFTEELADAVLDWIDQDDVRREFGAESEYYSALPRPYRAANGRLASLQSLLLVRGVTAEHLWGDLAPLLLMRSWGPDIEPASQAPAALGHAGPPQSAWINYLTVHSAERNVASDGEPRVFLNSPQLVDLHQQLSVRLGLAWANFIVLYRQFGPSSRTGETVDASQAVVDLSLPPTFEIDSPWSLLGARAAAATADAEDAKVAASPLAADAQLPLLWPRILDRLTVETDESLSGRVNWGQADEAVVQGIPGVDAAICQRAQDLRRDLPDVVESTGAASTTLLSRLLADGVIDVDRAKIIGKWITDGGDVASAMIVGFRDDRRPFALWRMMMDGSRTPARQVEFLDMRDAPPPAIVTLLQAKSIEAVGTAPRSQGNSGPVSAQARP